MQQLSQTVRTWRAAISPRVACSLSSPSYSRKTTRPSQCSCGFPQLSWGGKIRTGRSLASSKRTKRHLPWNREGGTCEFRSAQDHPSSSISNCGCATTIAAATSYTHTHASARHISQTHQPDTSAIPTVSESTSQGVSKSASKSEVFAYRNPSKRNSRRVNNGSVITALIGAWRVWVVRKADRSKPRHSVR